MTQIIRISSNPEGIVSAPIGSFFYRRGEKYFLINGITEAEEQLFTVNKTSFFRRYYNPDFYKKCSVEYVADIETWIKTDRSRGEKYGWQFVAYRPPTFVGEQVIPPTPTPSVTPEPTSTPAASATPEPTATPMVTPTPTVTMTMTVTPTLSATPEPTATPTPTIVPIANTSFALGGYSGILAVQSTEDTSSLTMQKGTYNYYNYEETHIVGDDAWISINNQYGASSVGRSVDSGRTWTEVSLTGSIPRYSAKLNKGVYADGKFVLIGDHDTIVTSSDAGMTWYTCSFDQYRSIDYAPAGWQNAAYAGIIHVDGRFIAARGWCDYSADTSSMEYYVGKYSDDGGTNWVNMNITSQSCGISSSISFAPDNGCIAYGNGILCMYGCARFFRFDPEHPEASLTVISRSAIISTDLGETWSDIHLIDGIGHDSQTINISNDVYWCDSRMTFGDGKFVAIPGAYETSSIIYSTNGLDWSL
jgi:photosystem II stability/assembly factor-like uncharacterized protein